MTVIIAIKEDNKIHLGSDRMISTESIKTTSNTPKFFKKEFQTFTPVKVVDKDGHVDVTKNDFEKHYIIFAGAGSDAIINYIRYAFRFPDKRNADTFETYLLIDLLPTLREELQSVGLLKSTNGKIDTEANFLIIYDGEIYPVFRELGYTPRTEDYCVIGIADEIALGSLYTTKNKKNQKNRIKKAIESCAYNSLYFDNNYDIVTITDSDYLNNK